MRTQRPASPTALRVTSSAFAGRFPRRKGCPPNPTPPRIVDPGRTIMVFQSAGDFEWTASSIAKPGGCAGSGQAVQDLHVGGEGGRGEGVGGCAAGPSRRRHPARVAISRVRRAEQRRERSRLAANGHGASPDTTGAPVSNGSRPDRASLAETAFGSRGSATASRTGGIQWRFHDRRRVSTSRGPSEDFGNAVNSPELFGFQMTGVSSVGHSPRLGELRAPVQVCGRRGRSLHSSQKIVECTGGPERVAVLRTILLRPTPLGIFQWHFAAFVAGGLKPSTPEQRSEVGQHS